MIPTIIKTFNTEKEEGEECKISQHFLNIDNFKN